MRSRSFAGDEEVSSRSAAATFPAASVAFALSIP